MDLEQIFYTVAALFTLAAIIYFAWEYLDVLPRITKAFLLFVLALFIFISASALREVDR
jgi:hypothetical protein